MGAIKKILIANRGEIAVRVISTCREMGIRTVAVHSVQDENLPFVTLADEAHSLGEGAAADTYLNKEKIIEIAKAAKADAIHPGYGFLSENADFARKVNAAGIIFIGPTPEAIALMGDKIASREAAKKAGLPLIPGYDGDRQDAATLIKEAEKIGYPILIKASAGGGGKGMRVVAREEELKDALEAAKREAQNAFGNDRVFMERYITEPRHIEVQVFSDTHGNHLHMFERECSIQRRHQKIVEETPSPALTDAQRKDITETAVKIAAAIGYVGAGTVEFILDRDGKFYFLEMNTRLQVEHPVTEMVTGLDLVRLQIEVAAGKKLALKQGDIVQRGHAVECRIYAEDPDNGFLPTTGVIEEVGATALHHVRLENGYRNGNTVTVNYDPMLAKLAAWSETREEAAETLALALGDVLFAGVKTNRNYLQRILRHPAFLKGETYTDFVERHKDALKPALLKDDAAALIVAAFLTACARAGVAASSFAQADAVPSPWVKLAGFRNS